MPLIRNLIFIVLLVATVLAYLYKQETKKILAFPPTAWTDPVSADCAVVLTGGPSRVREGFDLLSQERIKKLIISGVYPRADLRDIFPQWPFYGAISENDVILEKRSATTYGNAQQSLPLVEALKCRNLVLVTSRLHMYRSSRIFKSVFPEDFPIHFRAIVSGRLDPSLDDLLIEATKSLFYSIWAY